MWDWEELLRVPALTAGNFVSGPSHGDTLKVSMPPNLDVYVVSPARNRKTIESFVNSYVDRSASEDRGDEELMLLALDSSGQPSDGDDWNWEPSRSLSHIIERGLEFPRRAFSVCLKPLDITLVGAILAFDTDNQVIFGLSMDDEGAKAENTERAKVLLHGMAGALGATHGFIAVEEPAPLRGGKQPPPAVLVYSWGTP
jgi:hypothetical protein